MTLTVGRTGRYIVVSVIILFMMLSYLRPVRGLGAQDNSLAPLPDWPPDGSAGQSTRPSFSWSDVSGADVKYRIVIATQPETLPRDPSVKTCSGCVIDDTVSTPSYMPAPGVLSDTTTYYWRVQARSSTMFGPWSRTASFTTQIVDLPAPTLLAPPDGGTGEPTPPTFRWSEVPGADLGYRIMVASRPDALPMDPAATTCAECVVTATIRGASYTPAAGRLNDTATYYWQVQAQSLKRPGRWSAVASFTTWVVPGD